MGQNLQSVKVLPGLCKTFMTVSGIQILQLCVVSSSSGSGQSEVTKYLKYISCIFEAEFFMNVAVKSAILFSRAVVASVNSGSRPSEVKNSAVIGKLRTCIKTSFPVAEARKN